MRIIFLNFFQILPFEEVTFNIHIYLDKYNYFNIFYGKSFNYIKFVMFWVSYEVFKKNDSINNNTSKNYEF